MMKEAGMRLAKEKKSCDDRYRPYKVSFPGRYDPYELRRPLKDPRLGAAQREKDQFYKEHGFKDDDDDDVDVAGSAEDEKEHESSSSNKLPVRVVKIPYGVPFPTNFSLSKAERARSFEQTWKKNLNRAVKNEAKHLKEIDCECAEAAIKFYNQKHGTDYHIVETLGSYMSLDIGFWFHCNFRAQCESDPSPPKLFFAELNKIEYDQLIVKVCMPLDDGLGNRSRIVRGCGMCGNYLFHPVNGFEFGNWAEEETHRFF